MKSLSKREGIMLIALVIVLSLAGYYNFYLKAFLNNNANVEANMVVTTSAIKDAKLKQAAIKKTEESIDKITLEIDEYSKNVLPGLDRPEIIRMLDRSIYPYITNSAIKFNSSYNELGSNYVFIVELSFQVLEADYVPLLEHLRSEAMVSRVVTSSLAIINTVTNEATCSISLEILTENNQPFTFQTE